MPSHYVEEANLPLRFFEMAARYPDKTLLADKRQDVWCKLSYGEVSEQVRKLCAALLNLGIKAGDNVVICGENRSEWAIADLAVMSIGAISVPAYTTNTEDDHHYILSHANAQLVLCTGGETGQKMLQAIDKLAHPVPFICFDTIKNLHSEDKAAQRAGRCYLFSDLISDIAPHPSLEDTVKQLQSDDVCCIIYTSGTGGRPKGVMLTHRSIQANIKAAMELLAEGDATTNAVFLSLLPLSHSYEHTAGMHLPFQIGAEVWYCESADKISLNLAEVRPTLMTAVPRLYEVLHDRITKGVRAKGGVSEYLFNRAVELGVRKIKGETLSLFDKFTDQLVERLVRKKVKARLGGKLQFFVSGGAALNPDIGYFFLALGINILQGYGQTEASPLISANRPNAIKIETVGPVVGGVEVRLSDEGELLARGDCIMKGYWQDEKATQETIKEGWLYTGDLAEINDEGYITISGRKKDIIVNSGGDNIAPSKVEAQLTIEPEIEQVMVAGDKRPYLCAVIVPSDDVEEKQVKQQIQAAVKRANMRLSKLEQVRKFIIADEKFTVENMQMTPTLKVRRHVVSERYEKKIGALYK